MIMTVSELIAELNKYEPDLLVGGKDHYGGYLPVEYVSYEANKNAFHIEVVPEGDWVEWYNQSFIRGYEAKKKVETKYHPTPPFLNIAIEWAGDAPD